MPAALNEGCSADRGGGGLFNGLSGQWKRLIQWSLVNIIMELQVPARNHAISYGAHFLPEI